MDKELLARIAEEAGISYQPSVEGGAEGDNPGEPDVQEDDLGNVSITWTDGTDSINVMLQELTLNRRELGCLIAVRQNHGQGWVWALEPSRINLMSISAKKDLTKTLEARTRKDWVWRMAQVVIIARGQLTKSHQPVALHTLTPKDAKTNWLVKPLVERNEHTVLAAEGGTGKSLISLAVCIQAGLGRQVIPETWTDFDKPVNSLMLDWEADAETHALRMKQLCTGQGWSHVPNTIHYLKMTSPITEQVSLIREHIAKLKIGLVVVDSVGVALNGDINDATTALQYMNVVRAIGNNVAVLSLTHLAKENRGTPIGSVYFREGPRSMWLGISEQDEGSAESYVGLFHKKQNNHGRMKPLGLRAEFTPDAIRYYRQSMQVFSKASEHLTPAERVISLITNGSITEDEMRKILSDIKAGELNRVLNRLHKQGKVTRNGDEFSMPSDTPPQTPPTSEDTTPDVDTA